MKFEWKGIEMSDLMTVASVPVGGASVVAADPMIDKTETALRDALVGAVPEADAQDVAAVQSAGGAAAADAENPFESSYYPAPPFTPPPDIGLAETVVKSEVTEAEAKEDVREAVQSDTLQADVADETIQAVVAESPAFAPAAPPVASNEDTARKDAVAHDKAEAAVAEVRAIQETPTDQSHSSVL